MESAGLGTPVLTAKRTTTFLVAILVSLCSGTNYVCDLMSPER